MPRCAPASTCHGAAPIVGRSCCIGARPQRVVRTSPVHSPCVRALTRAFMPHRNEPPWVFASKALQRQKPSPLSRIRTSRQRRWRGRGRKRRERGVGCPTPDLILKVETRDRGLEARSTQCLDVRQADDPDEDILGADSLRLSVKRFWDTGDASFILGGIEVCSRVYP